MSYDLMTFPDTWDEFEEYYGFTDTDETYTNGARLIPSFRVKQWLDHLEDKPVKEKDIQRMEVTYEVAEKKEICQWKAEVDGATYGARIELWVPSGRDGKRMQ